MSKKRSGLEIRDYLNDMLEMIADCKQFTAQMTFDQFGQDKKTLQAVIRCLEVIGEAAKQIPKNVRKKYPQVPWEDVAGMRDKLIHEYFGADIKIIWDTIRLDLDQLLETVKKMLADLFPDR